MHLRLIVPIAAATTALAAVPITAGAAPVTPSCTVDVTATIPDVLQNAETASFDVSITPQGGSGGLVSTLSFTAGVTQLDHQFSEPTGTYVVHESAGAGWVAQSDQTLTLSASQCSATPSFSNAVIPAHASFQVSTVPAGSEAGWAFTLVGPGAPAGGEKLLTTGAGATTFTTPLQEGLYTIAQTTLTGWDQTSSSGCLVAVDYPADAGKTFACTVSDTQEGHVTLTATDGGQPPSGSDAFHFVLSGGPDNVLVTQVAVPANHGSLDFGLYRPGGYTLCQQAPPSGWSTTLVAQGGIPNASGDICLPFTLGAGQAKAFSVDTTGPAPSTPAPTAAPTQSAGIQGVNTGSGGHTTTTGSTPAGNGGIGIPNTGVGLSGLAGLPLVLLGAGMVVAGRRRDRR